MKYATKYVLARWLRKFGYFADTKPQDPPTNADFIVAFEKHTGRTGWNDQSLESFMKDVLAEYPSLRTSRMKAAAKLSNKPLQAPSQRAPIVPPSQNSPVLDASYKRNDYDSFIRSEAWRGMRYLAIRLLGNKCRACGRGPDDGVKIHVDHITPCSVDWSRRLDLLNLQVLCDECNLGKSNLFNDDWR